MGEGDEFWGDLPNFCRTAEFLPNFRTAIFGDFDLVFGVWSLVFVNDEVIDVGLGV